MILMGLLLIFEKKEKVPSKKSTVRFIKREKRKEASTLFSERREEGQR